MTFHESFVLFLILLVLLVQMTPRPKAGGWGKIIVWLALALLTVVLVLTHAIHFTR
jgi:DMSO/TMAO reductase YedYZ heme-binding membrane subunit